MLDTDPFKSLVRRAYKQVLLRQPDPRALDVYSNALKNNNIDANELYRILMNSDEYKQRNTFLNIQTVGVTAFGGKIAYIQTIYINDYNNALRNVQNFKRYARDVDCIVIYDDTINAEQMSFFTHMGAIIRYSKWLDDMPRQRNVALQIARQLGAEWVISSDPDEHFNELLIKDIRFIINSAKQLGIDLLKVNCVNYDEDKYTETPTEYFKDLIYELKHGVAYQGYGNLPTWHEGVFGLTKSVRIPKDYFYRHEKSRHDMLEHQAQGMFIVGGGPNLGAENPSWIELRKLTDILGIDTWEKFNTYLKRGNVCKELKDWMILHKDDNKKDGDQNARATFQYYFEMLHPKENTEHLTSLDFMIQPE